MHILAKRVGLKIVAAVSLILIFSLGFEAQSSAAPVSITSPAANSSVSATAVFTCADTAYGATVNLYINDVYVAGGHSPFSYSWNTTAKSNGSYYLVCNGYVNGSKNGSVAENVKVLNAAVAGIAVQNGMNGAALTAKAVNANGTDGATLATATANSSGQFTMNIAPQNGPVRFRAQGGSYVSEQNGATISAPSALSALLPNLPKSLSGLSINPLSTFIDALAQGNISKGQNLATALSNATASIEIDYGISANPATVTPLYTKAAVGTDARRLGLVLGAIVNQDQLACPSDPGELVAALTRDISDGVFDGKEFGTPVPYCSGELWAIAGNAQSSDALSGLQQLALSTRGFAFGGTNNALTLDGVSAAQVLADVVRIESGLVRGGPPSVNLWGSGPSLNTARAFGAAVLLPNGKVLIVGGESSEGPVVTSTELYNPTTNTFAPPGSTPMNNPPGGPLLLPNGKVLFAGGTGTELYDPTTNTFAPSTASMNNNVGEFTETLLPNGKVLFAGGLDNADNSVSSTELYDPATNKFAPPASTPVMNAARFDATATLLPNGQVLIAGGFGNSPDVSASTELYDSATNKFAPAASTPIMNTGRGGATATLLTSGKVLIAGGGAGGISIIPFSSAELYDPQTNKFAPPASTPVMNTPRTDATATLLPNGKVLIAGGLDDTGFKQLGSTETAELYNPATNSFASLFTDFHAGATETLLPNGKVLIAGGVYIFQPEVEVSTTVLYTP
jgi:hypothetical protein